MGVKLTGLWLVVVIWLLILPASVIFPITALASSSLDRHSPDFHLRVSSYGDVWTQQEVSALTEVLGGLKQYGVAYVLRAIRSSEDTLSKLVSKLHMVDERLSLVLKSILGLSRDIPEALALKIGNASLLSKNVSRMIKVINNLYSRGELSSADYLVLLGYVANEFKTEYIEDAETATNIRKAAEEVSSTLTKSVIRSLPGPDTSIKYGGRVLFIKPTEVPRSVIIATLIAVLIPPVVQISLGVRNRPRYPKFLLRAIQASDLIVSSLNFPEDTISVYWAAVGALSKVAAVRPWETHREYLARLERGLKNQYVLSAFKTLTEDYERVRFAGEKGSLNRKQLADLFLLIEKGIQQRD